MYFFDVHPLRYIFQGESVTWIWAGVLSLILSVAFPVLALDVPMNLTVTASTDNTITLNWGIVQGPIDHYKVTYTSASGVTNEVKNTETITMYMSDLDLV